MAVSTTYGRHPQTTAPAIKPPYRPDTKKSTTKTRKAVTKKKKKPVLLKASAARGPRYEIEVQFSSDKGQSFSNSKLAVKRKTVYYILAKFTQHQAAPLLQGVTLHWRLPRYWTFVDGPGAITYETCISNPLEVIRVVKSPSVPKTAYCKVLADAVFG